MPFHETLVVKSNIKRHLYKGTNYDSFYVNATLLMKKKYLSSLDGLRGISIVQVLFFHLSVLDGGTFLIQGFMVQSGYLITQILLRNKERDISKAYYLKSFQVNRFLRILPLYLLYLFISIVYYIYINKFSELEDKLVHLFTFNFNNSRMLSTWTHDTTFTHLWTISLDIQFYIIWPFVVLYLNRKHILYVISAFVVISPVIRYFMGQYLLNTGVGDFDTGNIIYIFTFSHIDAFLIGSLIPIIKIKKYSNKHGIMFIIALVLLFGSGVLNHWITNKQFEISYWKDLGFPFSSIVNFQHVWSYTFANLFFFVLIIILESDYGSFTKSVLEFFLSCRIFTFLGRYTFGIYIFHGIIITLVRSMGLFGIKWMASTIVFSCSIIMAMLSYHFFEKHFLKLKMKV